MNDLISIMKVSVIVYLSLITIKSFFVLGTSLKSRKHLMSLAENLVSSLKIVVPFLFDDKKNSLAYKLLLVGCFALFIFEDLSGSNNFWLPLAFFYANFFILGVSLFLINFFSTRELKMIMEKEGFEAVDAWECCFLDKQGEVFKVFMELDDEGSIKRVLRLENEVVFEKCSA